MSTGKSRQEGPNRSWDLPRGHADSAADTALRAALALPASVVAHGQAEAQALAIDAEGWLDVLWPMPQFAGPQGPERVDAEDVQIALSNFQKYRSALGQSWAGLPVYLGHPERDGTLASARAWGWAKDARIDARGRLQYRIEWTSDAQSVRGGAYKYQSGWMYGGSDAEGVWHPAFVSSVGLTNSPVMINGQLPMAHADGDGGGGTPATPARGASSTPDPVVHAGAAAGAAGSGIATPAAGVGAGLSGRGNARHSAPGTAQNDGGAGGQRSPAGVAEAAPLAHAAGAWWTQFTGALADLVKGATTADEALAALQDGWEQLRRQTRQMEALTSLVATLGQDLGVAVPMGADGMMTMDSDMGMALSTAAQRGHAAEADLEKTAAALRAERAAYHAFIVERAVESGMVVDTPEARAHAALAVAGSPASICALWFGPGGGHGARGQARAATGTLRAWGHASGEDRRAVVPPDPTAGSGRPHAGQQEGVPRGVAARREPRTREEHQAIIDAAQARYHSANVPERGDWGRAHAWAYGEFEAGRIGGTAPEPPAKGA